MKTKECSPRLLAVFQLTLFLSTALLILSAIRLRADSVSEMFERGIYSEETTGNLDAAIKLYRQVIEQAQSDQSLAAQAQYHLGLCYEKKHDSTKANAAFEAVLKSYPKEKALVALARSHLATPVTFEPAPWTDGETMRLDLRKAGGPKIGVVELTVRSGQINGRKTWRFKTLFDESDDQWLSEVTADAATLKPLQSLNKHAPLQAVAAFYSPDHVDIVNLANNHTNRLDLDGFAFDNWEGIQVVRCLTLANGLRGAAQAVYPLSSQILLVRLAVTGPEQVEVPAGTYRCYKITDNFGDAFWYSDDAKRYLVKTEENGIVGELTSVTRQAPGQAVTYSNSAFGFSLSAPAGWVFDQQETTKTNETTVTLIDPQIAGYNELVVQSMSSLKTNETASLRHFADVRLAHIAKLAFVKDFKIRPDSWQKRTIAGLPGIGVTGDCVIYGTKRTVYAFWLLGPTNAASFYTTVLASQFSRFQPKFEKVIASYQPR